MSGMLTRPGPTPIYNSDKNKKLGSHRQARPPDRTLQTRGNIEATICEGIIRLERECMGRGPKSIRTFLIGDLVLVRLSGILTLTEQQLVNAVDTAQGSALVTQARRLLMETSRPVMEGMVESVTGNHVICTLFDISVASDEAFLLFTLADAPIVRDGTKR